MWRGMGVFSIHFRLMGGGMRTAVRCVWMDVWMFWEEGDEDFIYQLLLALGVFKRFYVFCVV